MTINFLFVLGLIGSYFALIVSPESTVLFALLGLAFPALLIPNIAFFLYWILIRKKQFFLSLLTLIAGYYHISRFYQFSIFTNDPPEDAIKIMSYNVRLFDLYNWTENKKTRDEILSFLQNENADIICFQEYFYSSGTHFNTRDTLIGLLPTKNYYEYFTNTVKEPASQGGKSNFGSAIFSKYPIINKGVIPFENDPTNNCVFVDIVKQEDTLRIFNAHLGSIRFQSADYDIIGGKGNPEYSKKKTKDQQILSRLMVGFQKRVSQTKTVLNSVKSSPYPVVVCADMNDTPVSHTYGQFSSYLTDAFTVSGNGIGGTYIGNYPFLRIDYIWHSPLLQSAQFITHDQELSDHRAISCKIF